jgi:hypothetical protein
LGPGHVPRLLCHDSRLRRMRARLYTHAEAAAEGYNDHYSWIAFPECEDTMRNALKSALRA